MKFRHAGKDLTENFSRFSFFAEAEAGGGGDAEPDEGRGRRRRQSGGRRRRRNVGEVAAPRSTYPQIDLLESTLKDSLTLEILVQTYLH